MMRRSLQPHPNSPCDSVESLSVEVRRDGLGRLALRYVLAGVTDALAAPATGAAGRTDRLWEHTCFEAFVAGPDESYLEFNFAPSGQWAAYRFDGYRQGMAPLEIAPPRIAFATTDDRLELRVTLDLPRQDPLHLGLSAVIEEAGGRLSYWALAHPAAHPDFHHRAGFVLPL